MKSTSAHKRYGREGVTLIEILISIAILALLFVMLASALFYPLRVVTRSALKQNAIDAATSVIEDLFAQDYWDIDDDPPLQDFDGTYAINGQVVANIDNEAANHDPTSDERYRYIRVEVSYDNVGDDTVVLETFRSSMVIYEQP